MWDEDFIGWLDRMQDQLLELQKRGEEDKIIVLLVYAFTQVDRSKREKFIEHIQENLRPMTTTGTSIYDSLIEEGEEKGMEKQARIMVRNMHQNGMTVDEIAKTAGLEKEEVERFLSDSSEDS